LTLIPEEQNEKRGLFELAVSDGTPVHAAVTAVIVGTLLVLINQLDQILAGNWPPLWKVILTYLVPYCVTTVGAVKAKHGFERFLSQNRD
jgi:hypothetical protein